jgi:hypothetical protein
LESFSAPIATVRESTTSGDEDGHKPKVVLGVNMNGPVIPVQQLERQFQQEFHFLDTQLQWAAPHLFVPVYALGVELVALLHHNPFNIFPQGYRFTRYFSDDIEQHFGKFPFSWDFLAARLHHTMRSGFVIPDLQIDFITLMLSASPYMTWVQNLVWCNPRPMLRKKDAEAAWVKILLVMYKALFDFSGSRFLEAGIGQSCPGGQIMRIQQDVLAEAKRMLGVLIVSVSTSIFFPPLSTGVSLAEYSRYR